MMEFIDIFSMLVALRRKGKLTAESCRELIGLLEYKQGVLFEEAGK